MNTSFGKILDLGNVFLVRSRVEDGVCTLSFAHLQCFVVDINGDDVQAHCFGILNRQMAQPANAGDHDPIAGPGFGHLQTLINGHARTKNRRNRDPVGDVEISKF